MQQHVEYSISPKTIVTLITIAVGAFLVFRLIDLIFLVIVSLMLASALNPFVLRLHKKLPLSVSATLVVFGILLPIIGVLAYGIPVFIQQGPGLIAKLNDFMHTSPLLPAPLRANFNLSHYTQEAASYVLHSASTITGLVTAVLTLIFLTIYLLIDRVNLRKMLLPLIPKENRKKMQEMMSEFANVSGRYIRGNLLISVICTVFIFVGLFALGVPNAALLAVFAGMMDLLPLIGSLVAAAPALIIGFTVSPTIGILVAALFLLYQQVENHLLAPNIYNKALNLSPVFSLLAVIAGATLYGIPGAFMALPLAASIPALVEFIQQYEAKPE